MTYSRHEFLLAEISRQGSRISCRCHSALATVIKSHAHQAVKITMWACSIAHTARDVEEKGGKARRVHHRTYTPLSSRFNFRWPSPPPSHSQLPHTLAAGGSCHAYTHTYYVLCRVDNVIRCAWGTVKEGLCVRTSERKESDRGIPKLLLFYPALRSSHVHVGYFYGNPVVHLYGPDNEQ